MSASAQVARPPAAVHPPGKDYNHAEDPEYKRLRDSAEEEFSLRNECSQKSQSAYKNGDGASAKQFSEQAKVHERKAEEFNSKAAAWVFRANNADSRQDEIDLHGLYVKEALEYLEQRIDAGRARHESHLKAIVGKGNHSVNHVAKIKPAVAELCQKQHFRFSEDPHNSGVLVIDLTSGGGEVPYNNLSVPWNNHPQNQGTSGANFYGQPQAQGQPQPQGYPQAQGYPQPQGYQQNQYQQQQQHQGQQSQFNWNQLLPIVCCLAKFAMRQGR